MTARIFGRNWHEYSPPSVLNWFSKAGLSRLCEQFGFKLVASGRPAKWINSSHARSLIRYKLAASTWGRRFAPLTRLIPGGINFPYWYDDLFWALFQR
jgi:hypothetical protein